MTGIALAGALAVTTVFGAIAAHEEGAQSSAPAPAPQQAAPAGDDTPILYPGSFGLFPVSQ